MGVVQRTHVLCGVASLCCVSSLSSPASLKHARHVVSYFRERGIKNGMSVFMQTKA